MPDHTIDVDDLWIEQAANRFGFEWISNRLLGRSGGGPYILITTVVLVHLPLLSVVGYLQTGRLSLAENPGEVFQIPAWIAIIWILLKTKRTYEETIKKLPKGGDDPDISDLSANSMLEERLLTFLGVPKNPVDKFNTGLETVAPTKLKYGIVFLGLAAYTSQLILNPDGLLGPVIKLTGPLVVGIRFFVIIPFVLYPIGAELLTTIIGVLVLLPFKIRRANLVNFGDPHGYAGLKDAGELFKSVVVSYFILLTLYTTFETVAVGTSPTELFSSVLIIIGLCLGVVFFFAPVFWIKSYLSVVKEKKIDALAEATRQVGSTDQIFPHAEPSSVEDAGWYTYNHIRMQQVDATREFPVDLSMLNELLFALVLPYLSSQILDTLLTQML